MKILFLIILYMLGILTILSVVLLLFMYVKRQLLKENFDDIGNLDPDDHDPG